MHVPRAAALLALATLGVGVVAGCPPSLEDPQAFESGCPAGFSVDAFFQSTCVRTGCHVAGPNAASGLDLTEPGAFSRMYGVTSPACGQPLISPSGPGDSLLVAKLEGTAPCGARMPLGGAPLSATDITCVEAWITSNIAGAGPPPPQDAGSDAAAVDAGEGSDAGDAGDAGEGSDGAADDAGDAGLADASGASDAGDAG
jgi:hypothetical protein